MKGGEIMAEKAVRTEKDLVISIFELRRKKSALQDQLTTINKEHDILEAELVDMLLEEGKERTSSYEKIGAFTVMKPRAYATIPEEKREEAFKYLRSKKRGDLIIQTVMPGSISTYVRELLTEGKEVPGCISYYLKTSLQYVKPKES
jgi:hypothetical protein